MSNLPYDHALKDQVVLNRAYDDDLGAFKVNLVAGLIIPEWDSLTHTSGELTDTYVYALSGTTVATVVVTYTDSTKVTLSGVTKT